MHKINIIPSARKDLDGLDKKSFSQIKNKIISLASNPRPSGCLKLTAEEGYRIRSGNYRILSIFSAAASSEKLSSPLS